MQNSTNIGIKVMLLLFYFAWTSKFFNCLFISHELHNTSVLLLTKAWDVQWISFKRWNKQTLPMLLIVSMIFNLYMAQVWIFLGTTPCNLRSFMHVHNFVDLQLVALVNTSRHCDYGIEIHEWIVNLCRFCDLYSLHWQFHTSFSTSKEATWGISLLHLAT